LGNQGRADDQKGCLRAAFFRADALKVNVIFQSLFNNWWALRVMLWSRPGTFLRKTFVTKFSSFSKSLGCCNDIRIRAILVRRNK